jgi:cytochrome c peroxidase
MNNRSAAALASKIDRADYADGLRAEFGTPSLDDPERAIATLGQALQSYLESDALSPFTSRYDEYVRGRAQMSEPEMKGLRLFRSSDKGNCASCHAFNPSSSNPLRSLFTDFGYDAVAVPRNPAVPENRKPAFNDLGLCTTTAVAHAWPEPAQWCGYFKTPSLRNVAIRERFMHNGVFKDLRSVVAFYATRSIDPGRWYPNGEAFDDLPAKYRANVNIGSTPYNRRAGSKPALDDDDIDAIVAFLRTLTDRDLEPLLPQVKGR